MPYYPNYSNYLSNGYQQNYQQNYNQQVNNIIWVQGEAGAKSYLVAPNTTVQLWDSEANVIYIKSADASGMPNIKILDYTIRGGDTEAVKSPVTDFATKDDIINLENEISDLRAEIKAKTSTSRKTIKREVTDDE